MLGTFEVEHRKQKVEFASETYIWENLFPACNEFGCNGRREKSYPVGGLLNPGEGVESRVVQQIERTVSTSLRAGGNCDVVFYAVDPADAPATNTAIELDRIHNATGSAAVEKAMSLRHEILQHVVAIAPEIHDYDRMVKDPKVDMSLLVRQKRIVERLVSRRAPYAMLIRSYFRKIESARALFD
jgi:hypothetical protein